MAVVAIPEDQLALSEQIAAARQRADALQERLHDSDAKLASMQAQREKYTLLDEICASLDRLTELGGEGLFWGEAGIAASQLEHLAGVREKSATFAAEIASIEQHRRHVRQQLEHAQDSIGLLVEELNDLREEAEQRQDDYVLEREDVGPVFRAAVMPWAKQGEDEKRFRLVLLSALLFSFTLAYLMSLWTITPRATDVVEIPERLARLVKKELPKPPETLEERVIEEKEEVVPEKPAREEPTVAERQEARKTAESAGLMAFRDSFSELRQMAQPKLGVDARISDAGQRATGQQAQRALITAQAQTGSGGINTASLSRNVGGAGRQGSGVEFARVESSVGTDFRESDRPLSAGPGPSRTDEEIQIIFDRYKATLYRIYNRELRNDPTLRGKMVLRITIEPDGSVSRCEVESTDLNSPVLVSGIVDRVQRFNFGPKDGVPAITILYPIDFLPAN